MHSTRLRTGMAAVAAVVLTGLGGGCSKSARVSTSSPPATSTTLDSTDAGDGALSADTAAIDAQLGQLDTDLTAADSVDTEEQDPGQ